MHCFLQSPYGERSSDSVAVQYTDNETGVGAQRELLQKTTTYRRRLVRFSTVRTAVSEILVKDEEVVCTYIVLLSKKQLCQLLDFGDQLYGIQGVWKVDTQEPIRPV